MYISVAELYVTSLRAQSVGYVLTIDFLMTGYMCTFSLLEIAFHCLYRNTFSPAKHDTNNVQAKDTDAKACSSKH